MATPSPSSGAHIQGLRPDVAALCRFAEICCIRSRIQFSNFPKYSRRLYQYIWDLFLFTSLLGLLLVKGEGRETNNANANGQTHAVGQGPWVPSLFSRERPKSGPGSEGTYIRENWVNFRWPSPQPAFSEVMS
jgi:hypothetical protein